MDVRLLCSRRFFEDNLILGPSSPFCFVNGGHPAMQAMVRRGILPFSLSSLQDGEWFRVRRVTFRAHMLWLVVQTMRWFAVLRCFRRRLQQRRLLALAMAFHPRLGQASPLHALTPDLLLHAALVGLALR